MRKKLKHETEILRNILNVTVRKTGVECHKKPYCEKYTRPRLQLLGFPGRLSRARSTRICFYGENLSLKMEIRSTQPKKWQCREVAVEFMFTEGILFYNQLGTLLPLYVSWRNNYSIIVQVSANKSSNMKLNLERTVWTELLPTDTTFQNPAFWTLHPYASRSIMADHITILNPPDPPNLVCPVETGLGIWFRHTMLEINSSGSRISHIGIRIQWITKLWSWTNSSSSNKLWTYREDGFDPDSSSDVILQNSYDTLLNQFSGWIHFDSEFHEVKR